MIRRRTPTGADLPTEPSRKFSSSLLCCTSSSSSSFFSVHVHLVLVSNESGEPNFRVQEKIGETENRKARFGGLLKDGSEALKRPLTGLFRKTGKGPKKPDVVEEAPEATIAAPPTAFPNRESVSATIESVQLNSDYAPMYRQRDPETGSKLTLSDAPRYGMEPIHPLSRYFKVGDIDVSILARSFPKERKQDDDQPWTAQSLFNNLDALVKKEKAEAAAKEEEDKERRAQPHQTFTFQIANQ